MKTEVSVIIATHNRAEILRETLEAMCRLDTKRSEHSFIVVDNNSRDSTAAVIESFEDRLRLQHLFEGTPGKNAAVNAAIEKCDLGEIVVFSDDDVTPRADWLDSVVSSTNRWSGHSVFGGRVEAQLPRIPKWSENSWARQLAFSEHHPWESEELYEGSLLPFGPNFWIRRHLIDEGFRFNQAVGPRPTNRIMGSETSFLREVVSAGHPAVYIPSAVVVHRIELPQTSLRMLYRRAYRWGRSLPHINGIWRYGLLESAPIVWAAATAVRCLYGAMWYCVSLIVPNSNRYTYQIRGIGMLGEMRESVRLARRSRSD